MVSAAGAKRLLQVCTPIEVHVDVFLFLHVGSPRVRGFIAHTKSMASQCSQLRVPRAVVQLGGSIPHFEPGSINYKVLLPDASLRTVFLLLLFSLCLTVGCICRHHGT